MGSANVLTEEIRIYGSMYTGDGHDRECPRWNYLSFLLPFFPLLGFASIREKRLLKRFTSPSTTSGSMPNRGSSALYLARPVRLRYLSNPALW